MTRTKTIAACGVVLAALLIGVAAENRLGLVGYVAPPPDMAMQEFEFMSKFTAMRQFDGAPEYMLNDLVTDAKPLVEETMLRLRGVTLDANDPGPPLAEMLLNIADEPQDAKSSFMLNTVFNCAMFGVEYGRAVALRDGVTESVTVDDMVTRYAAASLEGFLSFLGELPEPPEPPEPPAIPESSTAPEGGRQQLDEWSDQLDGSQ